ncbi:MAG: hypothetical protein KKF58_03715 [Gammaproteobacteria bacterium]|nr:hypothetical protein [Gammaproteobacteria bacterium]MBU1447397.1 hypothetical protein [Gammaproteobacteria bacterium]
MLIRLVLLLSALLLAVSGLAYLFTRDLRYLIIIRQIVRFLLFLLLVFAVLYVLERFGLVAWRVFV